MVKVSMMLNEDSYFGNVYINVFSIGLFLIMNYRNYNVLKNKFNNKTLKIGIHKRKRRKLLIPMNCIGEIHKKQLFQFIPNLGCPSVSIHQRF